MPRDSLLTAFMSIPNFLRRSKSSPAVNSVSALLGVGIGITALRKGN